MKYFVCSYYVDIQYKSLPPNPTFTYHRWTSPTNNLLQTNINYWQKFYPTAKIVITQYKEIEVSKIAFFDIDKEIKAGV
jgi:hypothetical protein